VPSDKDTLSKYQLNSGDILFNNTNSVELVGKSALFCGHAELIVYSNHFTRIRVIPDYAEPRYVSSWLLLQWKSRVFENLCNRWIGQSAVKNDKLLSLKIPLPPLPEQKRIAAILNEQMAAAEKARSATEAQLEAAKALPAAYLRAVFNSPEAQRWPKKRLGEHVKKVGSGITPLGGNTSYQKSGIPLIRSQNVQMNRFEPDGLAFISAAQDEEMAGSRVMSGDVLLNITGASIGRVCVVPSELCPANVNQHVSIIRGDGTCDPIFLSYFISTADFQKFIMDAQAGATRQALTKALIENFQITMPPLSEQKQIVAILNEQMVSAERTRKVLEEQLDTINKLPAALLRRAFNGEL
jgi:type I restriction enzyme S subunit